MSSILRTFYFINAYCFIINIKPLNTKNIVCCISFRFANKEFLHTCTERIDNSQSVEIHPNSFKHHQQPFTMWVSLTQPNVQTPTSNTWWTKRYIEWWNGNILSDFYRLTDQLAIVKYINVNMKFE